MIYPGKIAGAHRNNVYTSVEMHDARGVCAGRGERSHVDTLISSKS